MQSYQKDEINKGFLGADLHVVDHHVEIAGSGTVPIHGGTEVGIGSSIPQGIDHFLRLHIADASIELAAGERLHSVDEEIHGVVVPLYSIRVEFLQFQRSVIS